MFNQLRDRVRNSSWVEKNPRLYRRFIDPTPAEFIRYAIMFSALGYMWYERYTLFAYIEPFIYGPLAHVHYWLHQALSMLFRFLPNGFLEIATPSFIAWWIYIATRNMQKAIMVGIFIGILATAWHYPPILR